MAATMSVFCLIETKFNDSKSGTEFGDAVFRMGSQSYEKFKWKVFYNTRKGSHSKQCQPFNENDIVHMFGKFTFIKVDGVETIALVLSSAYIFKRNEGGNMRKDLPDQAPVMSFFSRPIPNSHQIIDTVNSLKSTIDIYSAYNNEKTRLHFGILYNVIKQRWANIAEQWNTDKIFNIVGHYAAAKQNYIIINATEIDYEDISKSSNTSSDLANNTSLDSQTSIINRFYDSLNLQQSSPTTTTHNANSNQITPANSSLPSLETSNSSLSQQVISNHITHDATSNTSTSSTPPSQSSAPIYHQYPQYYQPNSTNSPNLNNTTLLPYPYFNQPHPIPHQFSPNLQQIPSGNISHELNSSQLNPPLNNTNCIVIEDISPTQTKKPPKTPRKRAAPKKKPNPTSAKKVRTRSDAKLNPNSEQGVMGLAVTSLLENDESDDSSNNVEITSTP